MKERDSSRDHHREHRDRDREHRSRDERSKDADDRHHGDRHRDEDSRARVSSTHDRHRTKDYPKGIETKRDKSWEPESRSGREGTRDRIGDSVDRERLRDSVDWDMGYREESVERRSLSSLHKRKEYGDTEDGHDKGEKRKRISDWGNAEKREKRRFKDEDMDNYRNLNGIGVKKESREGKYEDWRNEDEVRAVGRSKKSVMVPKVEKKMEVDVKLEDDLNSAAMNGSGFTANDLRTRRKIGGGSERGGLYYLDQESLQTCSLLVSLFTLGILLFYGIGILVTRHFRFRRLFPLLIASLHCCARLVNLASIIGLSLVGGSRSLV